MSQTTKPPSRIPFKRKCDVCQTYYEGRSPRVCCKKCSNKLQWIECKVRKRGNNYPVLKCKICKKKYQSKSYWKGRQTCSRPCTKIAQVRAMLGQNRWTKPTGFLRPDGYVMIYDPARHLENPKRGGVVMQHRFVMEQHLGRRLNRWELVHHRNGVKNDNRLENLEIVTHAKHKGQVTCPHCLKLFQVK